MPISVKTNRRTEMRITITELTSSSDDELKKKFVKYALPLFEAVYDEAKNGSSASIRHCRINICIRLYDIFPAVQGKYIYNPHMFRIKDRFQERATIVHSEPIDLSELNALPFYSSDVDTREMHFPEELRNVAGLYFLGMVNMNPNTKEIFYWVKIGIANDLYKRMGAYNTHCPMLWHIDYLYDDNELYYHAQLAKYALARCNHNTEWFMVDEKTYFEMCQKGFKFFEQNT